MGKKVFNVVFDVTIMLSFLVVGLGIGLYYNDYKKSKAMDFLQANGCVNLGENEHPEGKKIFSHAFGCPGNIVIPILR